MNMDRKTADSIKTCFAVGDPSAFTDAKFQVGQQFVVSPNTTFKDTTCDGVVSHNPSEQSSLLHISCEPLSSWIMSLEWTARKMLSRIPFLILRKN